MTKPVLHGRDHKGKNSDGTGGGADPAVLNVDSTDNVGNDQGVRSIGPGAVNETNGKVLTADGSGGSVWSSPSSGGIAFDTYPQAGDWLYVESTDSSGAGGAPNGYAIELKSTGADTINLQSDYAQVRVRDQGSFSAQHAALRVDNTLNSFGVGDSNYGIRVEVSNTFNDDTISHECIRVNGSASHAVLYGLRAEVTNSSSRALGGYVYGALLSATASGASATGPAMGLDVTASAASGATAVTKTFAGRHRGLAAGTNTTTKVIGVSSEAYRNQSAASDATIINRSKSVQGLIVFPHGGTNDDVGGILVDLNGGSSPSSGTSQPMEIYVNGTIKFRIDMDGTVHIPTGKSVQADL